MRKAIQALLKDNTPKASVAITQELIKEWLGNPKFKKTASMKTKNASVLQQVLHGQKLVATYLKLKQPYSGQRRLNTHGSTW